MKRKHYIILMVTFIFVIIACVFLSQTIQSITAPKAEFIKPAKKNISDQYQITGYFTMPDAEERYLVDEQPGPVTITKLYATPGLEVKKDQLLFDAEVSDEVFTQRDVLDDKLTQLLESKATMYESLVRADVDLNGRAAKLMSDYIALNKSVLFLEKDSQAYKDAQKEIASMEREMDTLFDPDPGYQLAFQWFNLQNAIDAMVDEIKEHPSQQEELGRQLDTLLQQKIIVYQEMLTEGVNIHSAAVQKIFDYLTLEKSVLLLNHGNPDYPALQERLAAMEGEIDALLDSEPPDQYDLVFRWYALLGDIDAAAQDLADFDAEVAALKTCVAPYDGVIIEVNGRNGHVYNGDQPLYTITASGVLGVAADVSRSDPTVYNSSHMYQCLYQGAYYSCDYVSLDDDRDTGKKTLYIKPKGNKAIATDDPVSLLNEAVTVYSNSVPRSYDYVLPSSAVFEEGGEHYIYIARLEKDFWGEHYKAEKTQVQEQATGGGYTGVDYVFLDYDEYVLNYWNKSVQDGERVIEYGD